MQPYSRPSNCVSDLITALLTNPILSTSFIDSLNVSNTSLLSEGSGYFILNRTSGDTLFRLTIDSIRFTIDALDIITVGDVGSLLYSATFTWGILDDSVPYLEDVKIGGYSQFERGGVDFYNIVVNGRSRTVEDVSIRLKDKPSYSIFIRFYGNTVRFESSFAGNEASILDFSGNIIYRASTTPLAEKSFLSWDGCSRSGKQVASGWYTVVWSQGRLRTARKFFFPGK